MKRPMERIVGCRCLVLASLHLLLLTFPRELVALAGSETALERAAADRMISLSSGTTTSRPAGRNPKSRRIALIHSCSSIFSACIIPSARALTPQQAASDYDTYAPTYDRLDGGTASTILGIEQARSELFRRARGNVLEIGVGTGLNLDKYIGSQLSSLTLLDISDGMLREAEQKVKSLPNLQGVPVSVMNADATTELVDMFGTGAFDTVVDSFSLCVMGNQGAMQCLDQISQVIKPSGQVLLLENARSSNPFLAAYQDATADAAAMAGGKGCVYNQDVGSLIRDTGQLVIQEERSYASGLFRAFVCVHRDAASESFPK